LFVGNICEPQIWNQVAESIEKFDFSICTHVFEDVRDPLFVAKGLMTISKAGFISMPNKHTEFWNIESPAYLGYCHHR
jgi:2-polyprenyl-3-methyl-5-hydroxy-6-metoxy-1,4-benzoquinol methylase